MSNYIERIRKHALKNYTQGGWDIAVECFTDEYLSELTAGCTTYNQALNEVQQVVSAMHSFRLDIQSEASV